MKYSSQSVPSHANVDPYSDHAPYPGLGLPADRFCNLLRLIEDVFCVPRDDVIDQSAFQGLSRGEPVSLESDLAHGLGVGHLGVDDEAERVGPSRAELYLESELETVNCILVASLRSCTSMHCACSHRPSPDSHSSMRVSSLLRTYAH